MGIGEANVVSKKKLKQAQLNFIVSSDKPNKRKFSAESPNDEGLAPKVFCKDSVQSAIEPVSVDLCESDNDDVKAAADDAVNIAHESRENKENLQFDAVVEPIVDKPTNSAETLTISSQEADTEDLSAPPDGGASESDHVLIQADSDGDELNSSNPTQTTPPTRKARITPRSSAKKAERLKIQEERRKAREEKEKKKKEELRLKEEQRKKKEDEKRKKELAKEEEKKRKEEEKRKKEEAKEEERKKKEEAKEEERKKKEEEKRKREELKEEDRRKKEEARLEEEKKEKLAKEAFTKFFIPSKNKNQVKKESNDNSLENSEVPKFMPFPIKADMRLACQVRCTLTDEEKNNLLLSIEQGDAEKGALYVNELKTGARKPKTMSATWPVSEEMHDVIIVEAVEDGNTDAEVKLSDQHKAKRQRAKLLQFHENRRPPYWGTWRKKSEAVTPRKPLGKEAIFDYEIDSDSEWEDEEEGEDIDKEADSDKEQSDDEEVGENGYVLDNTFVPHGYLSDEEAAEEDSDHEDQKVKLSLLKQELDQELRSRTQMLKPRLLGVVWISNETAEVSKGSLYEALMNFRCKWNEAEGPINVSEPAAVECTPSPAQPKFPTSMVEHLARLVHGSRKSFKALISEFLHSYNKENNLSSISKRATYLKIKEISRKTHLNGKYIWEVNPDLCAELKLPPIDVEMSSPAPVLITEAKTANSPLMSFFKKDPPTPGALASTPLSKPDGRPTKRVKTTLLSPTTLEVSDSDSPPVKKRVTPSLISNVSNGSEDPQGRKRVTTVLLSPSSELESQKVKKRVATTRLSSAATDGPVSPAVKKRVTTTLLPPAPLREADVQTARHTEAKTVCHGGLPSNSEVPVPEASAVDKAVETLVSDHEEAHCGSNLSVNEDQASTSCKASNSFEAHPSSSSSVNDITTTTSTPADPKPSDTPPTKKRISTTLLPKLTNDHAAPKTPAVSKTPPIRKRVPFVTLSKTVTKPSSAATFFSPRRPSSHKTTEPKAHPSSEDMVDLTSDD